MRNNLYEGNDDDVVVYCMRGDIIKSSACSCRSNRVMLKSSLLLMLLTAVVSSSSMYTRRLLRQRLMLLMLDGRGWCGVNYLTMALFVGIFDAVFTIPLRPSNGRIQIAGKCIRRLHAKKNKGIHRTCLYKRKSRLRDVHARRRVKNLGEMRELYHYLIGDYYTHHD